MIPIVIAYNNERRELVGQTLNSIKKNTIYPYELFVGEHKGNSLDYLKIKNKLVKDIPYQWDKIVISDDDMFFSKGWLKEMVEQLNKNLDVWVIAGTTWYTHKHLEVRDKITITNIAPGGTWIIRKEAWDKCGPYVIDAKKTHVFVNKLHLYNGKIAFLNNHAKVVHCGILSLIDKKRRGTNPREYLQRLANKVGAKTY